MQINVADDLRTDKIPVGGDVRQGDTRSPKLCTLALEEVFKHMDQTKYGIKIDGGNPNQLRFADDLIFFSSGLTELKIMLQQLNASLNRVELKMNFNKTKIMRSGNTQI